MRGLAAALLLGWAAGPPAVELGTGAVEFVVDLDDGVHFGSAVFLPDPEAVRGRACRFRIDATDADGCRASDEHTLTPF